MDQTVIKGEVNEGFELEGSSFSKDLEKSNETRRNRNAIGIRNAFKKFGKNAILKDLNLTAPEGTIYALLGASGSGKTTILNAILGLQKLDYGTVEIFGYPPGSRESGVPGSRIGYQPQDLSLYLEFSIREVIFFFGRIYGMSSENISIRMKFLIELLQLPDEESLIKNLSGGQQRRVSFAIALIHDAQILILDEPTVGVDPLLRQCIWDYLKDLVKTKQTTIIITTHYVEEAEQATIIGLMRNGHLLVENTPSNLKEKFNCSLDGIVMELCLKDENNDNQNGPELEQVVQLQQDNEDISNQKLPWTKNSSSFGKRMKALLTKNFLKMSKNLEFVLFSLFFPAFGVTIVGLSVGGKIKNLPFGLVNEEIAGGGMRDFQNLSNLCDRQNMSSHFLNYFPKDSLNFEHYENNQLAQIEVFKGNIWGFLTIPQNFSEIFPYTTDHKMNVYLDATNKLITLEITRNIQNAYKDLIEAFFKNCSFILEGEKYEDQILIEELFGELDGTFTKFITPSAHLLLTFFMAITLTSLAIIAEKKSGMFERAIVAGVNLNEIVLANFLSQYWVMLSQAAISLLILLFGFQLDNKGSIFGVMLITAMVGTIGILFGFVISIICSNESTVLQLTIAMLMPMFMISGIIWPIESMPLGLKYIALCLPQTLANESMRAIMNRGWSINHPVVWPGFAVSSAWILGLGLLILILSKSLNTSK